LEVRVQIDPELSVKLHAAPGVIDPESRIREKAEAAKKGISKRKANIISALRAKP
jgi:hypothetical protein